MSNVKLKQKSDLTKESTPTLDSLKSMRVVIAGTQAIMCDSLVSYLNGSDFCNITITDSGNDLISILRRSLKGNENSVDLILLDSKLDNNGSYQLCQLIRSEPEWENIPIILTMSVSGWQNEIAEASLKAGATDLLYEPIRKIELLSRVISSLSLKKERDIRKLQKESLITELSERKIIEARLHYILSHDELTGLSNRHQLEQELENEILRSTHSHHKSALLYIDLDQFKIINDLEGYKVGDKLLVSVANTLKRVAGNVHLISRMSSDEFAIILQNSTTHYAIRLAEEIRRTIEQTDYKLNNNVYQICASIGISFISPFNSKSANILLSNAHQACFVAKVQGRNKVHTYNETDTEMGILRNSAQWVPRIREALENNKFTLYFQPVFDLRKNAITGYETLLRMIDENGRPITPDNFIPVAEHMGLIHEIDLWVIKEAIYQLSIIPDKKSDISFNINLSGYAFQDKRLLPFIKEEINKRKINPGRIVFEITETAAVSNMENTRDMILQLHNIGCKIALDDFGAGFNSFNYLKCLPVDYLKIDGTFIRNLIDNTVDQTLVKSIVSIAHKLGKQTVGEFVENPEILEKLKEYGVDMAQGYYIGKPSSSISLD